MKIKVVLFSVFREKLPKEARGRTILDLPENCTLQDVLDHLEIDKIAITSVNSAMEYDRQRILSDGDEVQIFRPIGGG